MTTKLTQRVADNAALRDVEYFIWDSEVRGFGLRVRPSGEKRWVLQYRPNGGHRQRRLAMGPFSEVKAAEARAKALSLKTAIRDGHDPQADRIEKRHGFTVGDLCDSYMEAARAGTLPRAKKPATLTTDTVRIERHIKPGLGSMRASEVKRQDIVRWQAETIAGKTATTPRAQALRTTGGRSGARRTTGLLGAVFEWALKLGLADHNPVRGVSRPADGKKTRVLNLDEYERLGVALAATGAANAQAIRFVALTGLRKGEAMHLTWASIDERAEQLRLADSKTGPSVRPLTRAALDVLEQVSRIDGEKLVFPGLKPGRPITTLGQAMDKACERAGITGATLHTLRHSFGTVADELGYSESTISNLMGHKRSTITSRYIHASDKLLAAAAERVASEIARRLDGTAQLADVVSIGAARRENVS